jgi:hypothetical protein
VQQGGVAPGEVMGVTQSLSAPARRLLNTAP